MDCSTTKTDSHRTRAATERCLEAFARYVEAQDRLVADIKARLTPDEQKAFWEIIRSQAISDWLDAWHAVHQAYANHPQFGLKKSDGES